LLNPEEVTRERNTDYLRTGKGGGSQAQKKEIYRIHKPERGQKKSAPVVGRLKKKREACSRLRHWRGKKRKVQKGFSN